MKKQGPWRTYEPGNDNRDADLRMAGRGHCHAVGCDADCPSSPSTQRTERTSRVNKTAEVDQGPPTRTGPLSMQKKRPV